MTDCLWRLTDVTLAGRAQPRLEAASLEISGGVTAVLGHSGAGKTSLLNLLVDFEAPDTGAIERRWPLSDSRLGLFWVPHDLGLWPHLTVAEHLHTVMSDSPRPSRKQPGVGELLAAFDLSDKSRAFPDQLSQGERARLSVARACAADPQVLVLDEPLVHVDPSQSARYWEALREFRDRSGAAIVFSTHAPEVVLREAEHVICLREGRVVYSGDVARLYDQPPTLAAAWSLGPANWLTPEERTVWLHDGGQANCCLRPEQLAIEKSAGSPLVVQAARFCGAVAEVDLLDERSGRAGRFFHRPAHNSLHTGDRVALRVLALLLMCLGLWGCGGATAHEPQMQVHDITAWSVPAAETRVPTPRAIHWTADRELYVLDNAGRVLVFDEDGALVRHWWMPEHSVGKPERICLFRDGRLAVTDTHYHRLVFFDKQGKELGRMGSLGHDTGQFVYPVTVVDDDQGNFYVGEYGGNDRIQKFDRDGNFLLQIGTVGAGPGQFQRPSGLAWREGRLYVADAFNNRVQVFADSGEFVEILSSGEKALALQYPYDIALSSAGELFVVEYTAGRVSQFDLRGRLLGRFGSTGSGTGQFATPWALTVDDESRVFVADTENRRIVRLQL